MSPFRRSCRMRSALVLAGLILAGGQATAEPPEGKGRHKHKSAQDERTEAGAAAALVTAGITAALAHRYALDAGLRTGTYKPLPPGIRKNLARGKPLPPGIAKKAPPSAMLGRLPRHPGYEWQMAGTDLVLVQVGTAIVADVLKDVFR